MSNFKLIERDFNVFREVNRWRVTLSRHLKTLAGFSSQRTCDRRLKTLIEAGFLRRQKYIYGVPYLYFPERKAQVLIHASTHEPKIRIEQIVHDIAVLDTAIFVHNEKAVPFSDMQTEKELHGIDGFSNRRHRPDFVYEQGGQSICVEVELSLKAKTRLEKNIKENFTNYDSQLWIVPNMHSKISAILEEQSRIYPDIQIIELEGVKKHAGNH